MMPEGFVGKYRGRVTDNRDPLGQGRIEVSVPEVLGTARSWAMPCVPYAGPGVGLVAPPPAGANVWVEFEAGSADRPIWVGCFWGKGELPAQVPTAGGGVVLRVGEVTLVAVDPRPQGPAPLPPAPAGAVATELTMTGGALTVSRGGRPVLTIDQDTVTIQLAPLQIALSAPRGTLRLASEETAVTVAAASVELTQGPATVRVAGDGVALSCGGGGATVGASTVELASGAGKVTVTPAAVTINDGALEVT
jgi:hypothetical protein